MNPVIEISNGKTGESSAKGRGQSVFASTGKNEFDVLLSMLASTIGGDAARASHATKETSGKTAGTGETAEQKRSGSSAYKGRVSSSKMVESDIETVTSGKQKSEQRVNSSVKLESASKLITAGMPPAAPYQPREKAANQKTSESASGNAIAEQASSILPTAERDLVLVSKAGDAASGAQEKSQPVGIRNATQTKNASEISENTGKSPVGPDILQLMTATSSGEVDEKTLKELKGFLATVDGRNTSAENVSGVKTKSGTGVSLPHVDASASQFTVTVRDDVSAAVASTSKSSFRAAYGPAGRVKQADVAAAAAGQNVSSGDRQPVSGTQGNESATQTQPNQSVQAQSSRLDQNSQKSNDPGSKTQADTSNSGSAQINTPAMNTTTPNATFTQSLSSASQSLSRTAETPNLQQLAQGIVKQVTLMTLEGKKIVNVKLQPESLGSLTLQVVSDGGKISAQFSVRTADARAYLEASAPQMKQMLESNGVSLAHLSVNLSGGEFQSGNPRQGYKPGRRQVKYLNDTTDTVAPAETSRSFGYNTMEMQV